MNMNLLEMKTCGYMAHSIGLKAFAYEEVECKIQKAYVKPIVGDGAKYNSLPGDVNYEFNCLINDAILSNSINEPSEIKITKKSTDQALNDLFLRHLTLEEETKELSQHVEDLFGIVRRQQKEIDGAPLEGNPDSPRFQRFVIHEIQERLTLSETRIALIEQLLL